MVCHAIIPGLSTHGAKEGQQHPPAAKKKEKKGFNLSISLCFNYFNAYYFVNCIYTVILQKDILDIHLHHI